MATHIYRAIVRGMFADLDDATRDRLLAEVDEHEIFLSAFTAAGTFTYDRALVAFNFRFELREVTEGGEVAPDEVQQLMQDRAMERALEMIRSGGFSAKHLRVTAWDMADSWRSTR